MRRRLQKFLPIVMIALMVQIFAPIGACWAAAIAASDPLSTAAICHDSAAGQPGGQGGQHHQQDTACSICCLASAAVSVDTPKTLTLARLNREPAIVIWRDYAPGRFVSRIGTNAQARAPPFPS